MQEAKEFWASLSPTQQISAAIMVKRFAGLPIDKAIDAVLGAGSFERLTSQVYDALRAKEGDVLFNCQPGNAEPDWSMYRSLRIAGCRADPDRPGYTMGVISDDQAEFWTVYGEFHNRYSARDPITDCKTKAEAEAVVRTLAKRSGLLIRS